MTARYTLLAAAWVISATGAARASTCLTAAQDATLDRISAWAERMDGLGSRALREADEAAGDHATRFGTVIHRSCLSGERAGLRDFTIARFEAAIAYALTQAPRCASLGLKEFGSFNERLRRTVLSCGPLDDERKAFEIDLSIDHGYQPFRNPFRPFVTSPGWDHTYNVRMNTRPKGGVTAVDAGSIPQLAYHLAHELTHATRANNRTWHEEMSEVDRRTVYGCTNSLFLDRVYFVSSACFPDSTFGSALYDPVNGIFGCDGVQGREVCIRSLTETDPAMRSRLARAEGSASLDGLYGPPLVGGDYPRAEARRVCERLQRTTRSRPDHHQILRELSVTSWVLDSLPIADASEVLRSIRDVESLAGDAMRPGADLRAIRAAIALARARFEALVTELCAEPVARNRSPFCELRGSRARASIAVRQALAEGIAPGDFDLFTTPPIAVPPLPARH